MPQHQHTNATQTALIIAKRREEALRLKIAGHTTQEIALVQDVSAATVARDLREALRESLNNTGLTADEHRVIQTARLEGLLLKLEPAINEGDIKAIDAARKISESLRKLWGVDMPTRSVEMSVTVPEEQLRQMSKEELDAMLAAASGR